MILQNKLPNSKPCPHSSESDLAKRQASLIGHRYHVSPSYARVVAREVFGGEA